MTNQKYMRPAARAKQTVDEILAVMDKRGKLNMEWAITLADEVKRLRVGQAVVAKQVGFYKPDTPDFKFVRVPLGILRRSLNCTPPPYPEDG